MAAKFLGEPSKVVTGSHDRTLKIWDLRSRACVETKFAGSSCNDLVTTGADVSGTTIISGHYDKKIRFWDTRTDCSANEIILHGKITSLDLSKDCKYLLSCVRDDTIKLLDLRMNQIIRTFRWVVWRNFSSWHFNKSHSPISVIDLLYLVSAMIISKLAVTGRVYPLVVILVE